MPCRVIISRWARANAPRLFDVPAVAAGAAVEFAPSNRFAAPTERGSRRAALGDFKLRQYQLSTAGRQCADRQRPAMLERARQKPSINTTHAQGETWMSYRTMNRWTIGMLALLAASTQTALGQVVINEIVKDTRTASAGTQADTREFIELYNAGNAAVDIGGWTMNYWDMSLATPGYTTVVDTIPTGTMLAPGDFWVLGAPGLPNLDQDLGSGDLFLDLNSVFELRNGDRNAGGVIQDAVALDIQRGAEYAALSPDHAAFVGQGWWGQEISFDANAPNRTFSIGRYLDGRNSKVNGRDFGVIPITPGTSNNLTQAASYAVPNVDAQAVGALDTSVYASFKLPYVVDPTVIGPAGLDGPNVNPKAIPASPQGGKALMAWDETGGGNAVYSNEYVNKFALSAYIDTGAMGIASAANRIRSEQSMYGLGTADGLFTTMDATGLLGTTFTSNGAKGIGWYIQKIERFADADFDQDNDVDGNDFLTWQRNVGVTVPAPTNSTGDADANAIVNAADLNFWRVQAGSASRPIRRA